MKTSTSIIAAGLFSIGTFSGTVAQADPHVVIVRPAPYVVAAPPRVVVAPAPRVVRPAAPYCGVYGCSGSVTTTGPYGNTVTRSGDASCADGTCRRSGSVTGLQGETTTINRSISR
ncbi:MAG: hypothetical protein AAFV87_12450 [Pseudomonadota bacterium]